MACGCGKKSVQRTGTVSTSISTVTSGSKVQTAQTYQSATMKTSPQQPVLQRRTV